MIRFKAYFIILLSLLSLYCYSQEFSVIYGTIRDTADYPISFANVAVKGTKYGTTASHFGLYELQIPSTTDTVVVTCIGYQSRKFKIKVEPGAKIKYDFNLPVAYESLEEVKVSGRLDKSGTMQRIDPQSYSTMPNVSGNIENIVKTFTGVSSNNELSSQYSVRGGSFDENLVYVNDIEIYRPFLIRSGQQEGLSFVNPDLVGSLKFSAGGFDASYGDKMSSVLDIAYKRPVENAGSFNASALGAGVSYEGISKNKKFRHITGIRYKSSKYLLNSLDTKGEYNPVFFDAQCLYSYDLTPRLEASFLGNLGYNKYVFIPTNRKTQYGTFQIPLELIVYYEGKENDMFNNALGAATLNYHVEDKLSLKLICSDYYNTESETFDILGQYLINQLDKANSNKSDSDLNIGVGSSLNHARNNLTANILTFSHVGALNLGMNKLKWGLSVQNEKIIDKLNEWDMVDSAGYALPYSENAINLMNPSHTNTSLTSQRYCGYLMNTLELSPGDHKIMINAGFRSQYWSLNKQTVFNPRFSISFKPSWLKDLLVYFAAGYYNQPPFYKELRNPQGEINKNLKAQESIHFVAGGDYLFYSLSRPFKFTAEFYYKKINNLIPYRIDNVRMIYAGENLGNGYAAGMDFKINGEFVKGTESWFSLSLLQTMERLDYVDKDGNVVKSGYYPRPTDQFLNMSLFFQDYLPRNPSYKVHLIMHYGSELPVTIPMAKRWDKVKRLLPSYKRVDIGFSKLLKGRESVLGSGKYLSHFKEVWISAEVFNVIDINNTISYLWIKTVRNVDDNAPGFGYFAVPNYLTSRRFNIRLTASF
jgi:hypothetical protein